MQVGSDVKLDAKPVSFGLKSTPGWARHIDVSRFENDAFSRSEFGERIFGSL